MKRTRIRVEDLRVQCLIGAWTHERHTPQEIRVDLEIVTDARQAAETDALADAVDYSVLTETVRFVLQEGHFQLLETGVHMLQRVLLIPPIDPRRPRIEEVSVRLTKFGALSGDARFQWIPTRVRTFSASSIECKEAKSASTVCC